MKILKCLGLVVLCSSSLFSVASADPVDPQCRHFTCLGEQKFMLSVHNKSSQWFITSNNIQLSPGAQLVREINRAQLVECLFLALGESGVAKADEPYVLEHLQLGSKNQNLRVEYCSDASMYKLDSNCLENCFGYLTIEILDQAEESPSSKEEL